MKITKERVKDILEFGAGRIISPITDDEIMELSRIALASLEAEAVGEFYHEARWGWYEISEGDSVPERARIPLYRVPPAPVSVPDAIPKLKDGRGLKYVKDGVCYSVNYANGWNQCRAAMLQGAEPVSQSYTLRDGVAAIRSLGGIDAGKIQAERDALNEPAQGWIPVSERMPDDTVDADGGATCYLVFYAEGRQPNGGSNVQVSNVTYLRRWHEGMITHWMPLPAAPQQEVTQALAKGMERYGDAMQKLADGGD